jgi:hypothetical protein
MRLIVHIGTAKTGTSTLQSTLNSNAQVLARAGILYPKPQFRRPNHNDVTRLLHPMEDMQREFTSGGHDFETIRARGFEFWRDVQRQVKKTKPDVVVLSGEYLYGLAPNKLEVLRGMLQELTPDIEIVCYVREPASYYVSFTQQVVKASYRIRAPGEFKTRARECLPRFMDAFGGKVSVRAFDRTALVGGDIVKDFATTFLPDGADLANAMVVTSSNESMSAEAMCILQALRRHEWPDQNDHFFPESNRVRHVLDALRHTSAQTPATLVPELHAAVVRRNLPDLRYLEEQFGVVIDHEGIEGTNPDPPPPGWMSHDLREILDVDPDRIERTLYAVLRELAARDAAASSPA